MNCTCDVCVSACEWNPGWFLPGEVEQLAAYLNCSVQELFDTFLVAEYWVNPGDQPDTYVLSPVTTGDLHRVGGKASWSKRGACVFLHEGRCGIHEYKPYECSWFDHTKSTEESAKTHEYTALAWKNEQEQIKKLLKGES